MNSKTTKFQDMMLLELRERQNWWISQHPSWDKDIHYKGEDIVEVLEAVYKRLPFYHKILLWLGIAKYHTEDNLES